MVKRMFVLGIFLLSSWRLLAAGPDSVETTQGMSLGGMIGNKSSFFIGKYEYMFNNLGIQIAFTRAGKTSYVKEDKSTDKFRRVGYGVTFRYYVPKFLKGVYGAVALSSANVFLATNYVGKQPVKANDFLNLAGVEIGYRWRPSDGKVYGELGLRRMYSFNDLKLSTLSASPVDVSQFQSPSHQWNYKSGQKIDEFYLSIGYLF